MQPKANSDRQHYVLSIITGNLFLLPLAKKRTRRQVMFLTARSSHLMYSQFTHISQVRLGTSGVEISALTSI